MKLILAAFLCAAALPARAAEVPAARTLSLQQAVDLALRNNLDVALAGLRKDTTRSDLRRAWAAAIPDITLTGSLTRNMEQPKAFFGGGAIPMGQPWSMRHAATIEQVLYAGGAVASGVRAARAGVEVGEADLAAARADVVLAVRSLFYGVLLASDTARIQADNLASAEDHLRTIRERYRQGLDSDLVLLRQQVEAANAKPALLQARNAQELAVLQLKDTLHLDVDEPVEFVGALEPPRGGLPSYEGLVRTALENSADYKAARSRALQAEAVLGAMKGKNLPWLTAVADYQWYSESRDLGPGTTERDTSSMAGLRLRWPLFTGGEIREQIRQARITKDASETVAEKVLRAVRLSVKRAWLSAAEAAERSRSGEEAVGQARRALEATEVRYRAGQSSQLELTDATLALQRASLLYAQALHDYRAELASLERAAGVAVEEASR